MKNILKNKKVVMTLLGIILVFVVMVSTTYSLFFKVHTMDNVESYTSGILQIEVDKGEVLTLANSLPITDEEGKKTTPYNLTIRNTGNLAYTFDLKLLSTTTSNGINPDYIKVMIDDNEPVLLSSLSNGIIKKDLKLDPKKNMTLSVRIWLSIDTPNTEIGKNFSAKIVTDGVGSEPKLTGAKYIESLLPSNPETMNNDDPDGNVRYMGKNPNNYVRFNDELWRIIGVFDVKSSENGQPEKRLKIIKDEPLGEMLWDSGNKNDWTQASLQTYLNGEYYNSLTSESKELVGDTYWNIGGSSTYNDVTSSMFYDRERGTTTYGGQPATWIGKIGLMYPSDYGYAISGGTTTNRASCLEKELFSWDSSSYSDCKNNDYLYNSSLYQWTITSRSSSSNDVFLVYTSGYVGINRANYSGSSVSPVLYLNSDVTITGGTGTSTDPYILEMPTLEVPNLDTSGANTPDLVEGLIPITYKDNKWVKADEGNGDIENLWYDYNAQKWANAVLVNNSSRSTYQNASVGTEVKEADILAYYVWIPRYKYKLFNAKKVAGTDSYSARTTGIDIVFENGKEKTGTVTCTIANNGTESCTGASNGTYYTHPAFTFGNIELKGIWVGKFELTGNTTTPTVKPNISSLRNINVSTISNTIAKISKSNNSYGINSSKTNSHMMKNMEWGAVAYLTNSKYGRCPNGTCTEIGINNNSNFTTGCGAAPGSSYSSSCNAYTTANGKLASTTKNTYGVYDLSGGAYEYVMGNMVNNSGGFNSASSGFSNTLESKYYDKYPYNGSNTAGTRGHLGDATSEVVVSGNTGWNSDYAYFVFSSYPWFLRGGVYYNGSNAGAFYFYSYVFGDFNSTYSGRAVLVRLD